MRGERCACGNKESSGRGGVGVRVDRKLRNVGRGGVEEQERKVKNLRFKRRCRNRVMQKRERKRGCVCGVEKQK